MVIVTGRGSRGKVTSTRKDTSTSAKDKYKSKEKEGKTRSSNKPTAIEDKHNNSKSKQQPKIPPKAKKEGLHKNVSSLKSLAKKSTTKSRSASPNVTSKSSPALIRNNTIPENMVTSGNGPRIQAQRKFAQAGNIYSGTLQISTSSPFSTPHKDPTPLKKSRDPGSVSKKVKKPLFSPPPCKRPRTEDFLTFLCVRGTAALPPELDFFNFPQVQETVKTQLQPKKVVPQTAQTAIEVKEVIIEDSVLLKSENLASCPKDKNSSKVKSKEDSSKGTSVSGQKAHPKQKGKKEAGAPSFSSTCKAENPTKGIRATASSVLFSKLKKHATPVVKAKPVLSPPRSRLNEQDARFAMTALKLKYHRLATSRPNRSMLLTKRVKEKSIILTRSKARSGVPSTNFVSKRGRNNTNPFKSAVTSPSRNAPSPDIIFGVSSCPSTSTRKVSPNSSESESEDGTSEAENASSSSEEKTPPQPSVRSLRSGKELSRPKSPATEKKTADKKKDMALAMELELRRVGTRSAQRITKSPLRELPMYKVKGAKPHGKLGKKLKKQDGRKDTKDDSHSKRSKSKTEANKNVDKDNNGKRPMRKTKETASIYLGLLTEGFSTDEEDSEREKRDKEDGDSDLGTSSSSETKFLEKHYNASLKRVQQTQDKVTKDKESSGASSRSSRRDSTTKNSKIASKVQTKAKTEKEDRQLRSKQSKDRAQSKSAGLDQESSVKRKRGSPLPQSRQRQFTPTVGDRKMPGAARKSASITCRRRSNYSSSEQDPDGSSSSDRDSSDEKDDNRSGSEDDKKVSKPKRRKSDGKGKKKSTSDAREKSDGDTSEEESSDDHAGISEPIRPSRRSSTNSTRKQKTNKGQARGKRDSSASSKSSITSEESKGSDQEENMETEPSPRSRDGSKSPSMHSRSSASEKSSQSSGESGDDDEYDEPVPIKVDMWTQVDMDVEEGIIPPTVEEPVPKTEKVIEKEEDTDDEIQEIGQVFASSSTSTNRQYNSQHSHSVGEQSMGSGCQTSTGSSTYHQQLPSHHPMNTMHSQFNPFATRQPTLQPEFYTPLQLTPSPLVHSSIQLVGSTLGGPSFPMTNPLNTLSIPVSVPFSSHLLPHAPIGFATGSTFHSATTLQTHIRSVATNLDIPLVRPVMGADNAFSFMPRAPPIGVSTASLTRPPMGVWSQHQPLHHSQVDHTRSHYSAFRVPHAASSSTSHQIIHHQSTTVLGMNTTPVLPVSIIQPQQQHSSHSEPYRHHHHASSTSKQRNSYGSKQTSNSNVTSSSSNQTNNEQPPGYNIIKNLPNVSIVPKFDRNSKPTSQLPSQEPSSSSSKSKSKGNDNNTDSTPKKVGRKKKPSAVLPQPSSPLTVRKDSNPATYLGLGSKKQLKTEDGGLTDLPDSEEHNQDNGDTLVKSLKVKKEGKNKTSSPAPSCSSGNTKQNKDQKLSTPSSQPSKSQSTKSKSSPSGKSSPTTQSKVKQSETILQSDESGIIEAPTFHPTEEEYEDPLKYILKIQASAEKYGMARIVPPRSFRPECNVQDDMRFTAYNHYIHKMYRRWGPNVLESRAIQENLKTSQFDSSEVSMIGGMEINLSTLYQTVQSFGGLKEVIEKERWTKVADTMHVPKAAHDRATKLDAIYVKFILPYEMLSDSEREKLKQKVKKRWGKRKEKVLKAAENSCSENSDEDSMDELDECIVKGKTTPLSTYFRVARNTSNIFFPTEKTYSTDEIEEEYWKIVEDRNRHVCVYSGSIDCAGVGWGFPIPKASNKHPWNLKVLANNQGSVLRSMGPVMGATVPTLHVSMLFTTYCWYRDPHSLPWVEYLHSGANKIWYSVAAPHENVFRKVLTELMPMQCKKKQLWLSSDSAMVPPDVLLAKGVPLVRAVQNPGEFLLVFPKAYTSAICTGYLISESVCFAYPSWLENCIDIFKDIRDSKEPPVFPLEKLLLSILQDARASLDVVRIALPIAKKFLKEESALRKKITGLGVKHGGKISTEKESRSGSKKKAAREEDIEQCYHCNYSLYLSMVRNTKTDVTMCLKHAVEHFSGHKADIKKSTLLFDMNDAQLSEVVENASKRCSSRKQTE